MTDLIKFNSPIALNNQLKDDPFAYLFLSHLPPNPPLTGKTRYLKEFALFLAKLEAHIENTQARNHWLCISSGFSAAITVAGSTALIPVAGVILSGGAIVAAVGTIIDAVMTKNQVETLAQTLKRHRLALNSQESQQWAALWEYAESDLFVRSLDYASDGFVVGDKLVQRGDDSPFMRAVAFIAECKGMQYVEVIEAARAVLAKPAVSNSREKPMLPAVEPTRPQEIEKEVQPPPDLAPKPVEVTPPLSGNAIVQKPTPSSTKWINNFISQTALLWGNQGSGKSWMARYIAKLKKDKGYRVVVLDPDSNRAEWEGVESYHDFEEIAEFLAWYVEELKGRYKAFNASNMTEDAWRAKLWADGKALALICEEVTTYIDLIEDKDLLTQFFRLGLTKSRKQEMPLTFVSHNNTQSALGGIKGLANLIEKMLQLELKTDIDPETLQPVASGKGAVKLDGSNQWVPVVLPKLEKKITSFGESQPTVIQPVTAQNSATETQQDKKAIASTEPLTELKVSDSLGEPLKTIWLMAKERKDWITVRDIQRKDFATLKGKGSEQIHQYLGLLADSGYGEIDEEGKSHSSVRFKAH
jgi:hypothetical protein